MRAGLVDVRRAGLVDVRAGKHRSLGESRAEVVGVLRRGCNRALERG